MLNRRDIILIITLIVLATGSIAVTFLTLDRPEQGTVVVRIAGETVAELPLEEDGTFEFEGLYGPFTIEIRDRQVRLLEESTPYRYAVLQGWLDNTSSSIVSLPNEAVVEIRGEQQLDGVTR